MQAAISRMGAVLTFAAAMGAGADPAKAECPALPTLGGAPRDACAVSREVEAVALRHGLRATAIALVEGGQVVYSRSFGTRTGAPGRPADDDTVFRAASLSKPVFACLVMGLVFEGRIDLDRPLAGYLPQPIPRYPAYQDLVSDDRAATITARHVLTHRAGLPNWRWQAPDRKLSIRSTPGDRFAYSGEGYQLLQLVVEQITGMDLETLARRALFEHLGAKRTSYVWREEYAQNSAVDREPIERFLGAGILSRPMAAGSLLTTASEYGRFLAAVLTASLLRADLRDRMLEAQIALGSPRLFGPPAPVEPPTDRRRGNVWCLGWGGFSSPAGPARYHVGYDSPEYDNYAVIYPQRGLGLVILTHGRSGSSSAVPEIVAAVLGPNETPFAWMGYGE